MPQDVDDDYDWLGRKSKFGGEPVWIRSDERPYCEFCKRDMMFVAQIDSVEHQSSQNPHSVDALSKEQRWMFGDVGMIYNFYCDGCHAARAVMQCS